MTTNPHNGKVVEPSVFVAFGLGANLGSPTATIVRAAALLRDAGVAALRLSGFYRTEPVGCVPGTPPFVNAAAAGEWGGSPEGLLSVCAGIEQSLGRPALHSSRESRTIDIDILLFGDRQLSLPHLIIPHPRLCERLFVLAPLAELVPGRPVPGSGRTVEELRRELAGREDGTGWGVRLPGHAAGFVPGGGG